MAILEGDPGLGLIPAFVMTWSPEVIWELAGIAFLIVCSALMAGSESAFYSLKKKDLAMLEETKGKSGLLVVKLLNEPKQLLATILIINTIINISVAILAATVIKVFITKATDGEQRIIEVVTVTFTLVLFGEVMPKIYGAQFSTRFAKAMAYPMFILNKVFYPLSFFLTGTTGIIERRMRGKQGHDLHIEEIKQAIEITSDDATTQDEKKILRGIISFSTTYVKQIMTPRLDVISHDINTPFRKLVESINENRYSRLPIFHDTLDNIEGILYIKDIIPYLNEADDFNWRTVLRQPYFVPDSKKIDVLLEEFQIKKMHLAIVVDEYGGTAGIISMEDILEEIVGDINDEFDDDEVQYSILDETNAVFNGKTSLNDVIRIMNLEDDVFEIVRGEAESIGGLVVEMAGNIPAIGETHTYNNFQFTVESADRKRVRRVKLCVLPHDVEEEEHGV